MNPCAGVLGVALAALMVLGQRPGVRGETAAADVKQQPVACGQGGMPACPLQGFMRAQVAATLARGDMAALAGALERVAANGPSEWASWGEVARQGASAAKQG